MKDLFQDIQESGSESDNENIFTSDDSDSETDSDCEDLFAVWQW